VRVDLHRGRQLSHQRLSLAEGHHRRHGGALLPWYMAYPLSSRQVLELLAELGIYVSHSHHPELRPGIRSIAGREVRRRRRVGKCWFVDEVLLFRKDEKRYLFGDLSSNIDHPLGICAFGYAASVS
jgi:hypothetical protein